MKWERTPDMPINSVNVNKNGYVSVITKNTVYKAVVTVFSPTGDRIFRTYISDSYGVKTEISPDDKHLIIGSINYSKPIGTSNIKIVSIEKAKTDPENAIINEYNESDIMIDFKYKNTGRVLVQYPNKIKGYELTKTETSDVLTIEDNIEYVDINNDSNIVVFEKNNVNLISNELKMKIYNAFRKKYI